MEECGDSWSGEEGAGDRAAGGISPGQGGGQGPVGQRCEQWGEKAAGYPVLLVIQKATALPTVLRFYWPLCLDFISGPSRRQVV